VGVPVRVVEMRAVQMRAKKMRAKKMRAALDQIENVHLVRRGSSLIPI
jgi:hypothetical protein